jgi:WD repeat-containing protein 35
MTLSSNYFFISRSLGNIYQYDIKTLKLIKKHNFKENIKKLGVSPFETYLWTIDTEDILRIHNIKYKNKEKDNKKLNEFTQKDVWELEWVHKVEDFDENFEDNLDFVTVERNKLFFYTNLKHESDPYICIDYLAAYIDNEAIAVKLEDLINNKYNENINPDNYIKKYQNQILAQFNNMIDTGKDLNEIYEFIKKNPSKNLFKKLSLKAMENSDFDTAQKSLLQINDFNGIEFLNRVKNLNDPELQKAEIAQYNADYEEASKLFSKTNRNDLKLEMLMKLGKWDEVTEIMDKDKNDNKTKEEHMKTAYNNYADELYEKKEYDKAEEYYDKAGNLRGKTNCYFAKEEYDKATKMLEVIPEEDEYLEEMGDKFLAVGMCDEAVAAYTKHGNIKKGIESYINNNKWEEAIDLSAKNGFIYMQDLVDKFSDQFRLSGKKLDLVNLYRKANMSVEVHKYLCEIAEDMRKYGVSPITIKKIYVLAALELERYKAQINQQIEEENLIIDKNDKIFHKNKINYLDEALHKEIDKIKNNHWRGAEAYHYYLLCQVQLHKEEYKASCKTSMRLKFYEDILGTETVYRLIAICSYMNKCYKFFAMALGILSNDTKINKNRRVKYKQLAKDFFLKTRPENIDEKFYKCPNEDCQEPISEYYTHCNVCGYVMYGCVLSGRSILDNKYFKCKQCRNKTIKIEVKKKPFKHCPLCHVNLFEKKKDE